MAEQNPTEEIRKIFKEKREKEVKGLKKQFKKEFLVTQSKAVLGSVLENTSSKEATRPGATNK